MLRFTSETNYLCCLLNCQVLALLTRMQVQEQWHPWGMMASNYLHVLRDCGMALLLMVLPWRSFELRSRMRSQKRPRPKQKREQLAPKEQRLQQQQLRRSMFQTRYAAKIILSTAIHGRNTNDKKCDVHVLPAECVWSTSTRLHRKEHRWHSIRIPSHVAAHVYA